jgi:hypothetical protein
MDSAPRHLRNRDSVLPGWLDQSERRVQLARRKSRFIRPMASRRMPLGQGPSARRRPRCLSPEEARTSPRRGQAADPPGNPARVPTAEPTMMLKAPEVAGRIAECAGDKYTGVVHQNVEAPGFEETRLLRSTASWVKRLFCPQIALVDSARRQGCGGEALATRLDASWIATRGAGGMRRYSGVMILDAAQIERKWGACLALEGRVIAGKRGCFGSGRAPVSRRAQQRQPSSRIRYNPRPSRDRRT